MTDHTPQDSLPEGLTLYTDGPMAVGVVERDSIPELDGLPLAQKAGVYVARGGDQRAVESCDSVAEGLLQHHLDNPWFTRAVFFVPSEGEFSSAQIAYLEDRLAHMFQLEDFDLGPRAPRDHSSLDPALREQARVALVAGLEIAEAQAREGLFCRDDNDGGPELAEVVMPLTEVPSQEA